MDSVRESSQDINTISLFQHISRSVLKKTGTIYFTVFKERLILRSFFPFATNMYTASNCTMFSAPQWPISNVYNLGKDHLHEGIFPGFM